MSGYVVPVTTTIKVESGKNFLEDVGMGIGVGGGPVSTYRNSKNAMEP